MWLTWADLILPGDVWLTHEPLGSAVFVVHRLKKDKFKPYIKVFNNTFVIAMLQILKDDHISQFSSKQVDPASSVLQHHIFLDRARLQRGNQDSSGTLWPPQRAIYNARRTHLGSHCEFNRDKGHRRNTTGGGCVCGNSRTRDERSSSTGWHSNGGLPQHISHTKI